VLIGTAIVMLIVTEKQIGEWGTGPAAAGCPLSMRVMCGPVYLLIHSDCVIAIVTLIGTGRYFRQ
jgi:hypothetical protein